MVLYTFDKIVFIRIYSLLYKRMVFYFVVLRQRPALTAEGRCQYHRRLFLIFDIERMVLSFCHVFSEVNVHVVVWGILLRLLNIQRLKTGYCGFLLFLWTIVWSLRMLGAIGLVNVVGQWEISYFLFVPVFYNFQRWTY